MRFELPSLRGREAVVLGASGILSGSPFRLQLAVLLQTVQRREQRSRIDRGLILAEDRESLRDAIAVPLVGLSYLIFEVNRPPVWTAFGGQTLVARARDSPRAGVVRLTERVADFQTFRMSDLELVDQTGVEPVTS